MPPQGDGCTTCRFLCRRLYVALNLRRHDVIVLAFENDAKVENAIRTCVISGNGCVHNIEVL